SQREISILEMRLGIGSQLTLAEIAQLHDVSRERIRQIQVRAGKRLRKWAYENPDWRGLVACVESSSLRPGSQYPELDDLLPQLRQALASETWTDLDDDAMLRLCLLLRAYCWKAPHSLSDPLRCICLLPPPLKLDELECQIKTYEARERQKQQDATYSELAFEILAKEGKPLHWQVISERAESLGRRKQFSPSSMFNMLCSTNDFVRTAPGTYGLAKWGLEKAEPLVEWVALILHDAGMPLPYGAIL